MAAVFDPGGIIHILFMQFCARVHEEGHFQPWWKVKGLEQYTSWKLRVPDCFFVEKYEHQLVHIHIHRHSFYKYMYKNTCTSSCACTRLGGWLCGWVVWCGVVLSWCPCPWCSQT